jgi:hypothetical protein
MDLALPPSEWFLMGPSAKVPKIERRVTKMERFVAQIE